MWFLAAIIAERVGLVAPFLEIEPGDLAEDAGKAALDVGFFAHVGSLEQVAADLRPRRRRHLLDADHQHDARRTRGDRLQALLDRGGTGGAGILHPRGALEAQIGRGLQHQRGGKILRGKASIEMPEHDFVDILGGDAGVLERVAGHLHDQALDRLVLKLAEGTVGPTDDGCGHNCSPCADLRQTPHAGPGRARMPNFGRITKG